MLQKIRSRIKKLRKPRSSRSRLSQPSQNLPAVIPQPLKVENLQTLRSQTIKDGGTYEKAKSAYEQVVQQVADLQSTNEDLSAEVSRLELALAAAKRESDAWYQKFVTAQNRVVQLELDTRNMGADQLLLRAHEIKEDTELLIITTPHVSLVNHATFANLTNRLQNICKHLKAIVMVKGEFDIRQVDAAEGAKAYNLVPIPWRDTWVNNREMVLARVSDLFDRYARNRGAQNVGDVYR